MHHFRKFEESEKWKASASASPPSIPDRYNVEQRWSSQRAHNLWQHAKKYFYYRNDNPRAASLCKRLIAHYAQTEEADDAKLLLHDIRIEIKKLTEGYDKKPVGPVPEEQGSVRTQQPAAVPLLANSRTKFSIATAVVVIPIIGIAQGGIIGIVAAEMITLLAMASVFWIDAGIRLLLKKIKISWRSLMKPADYRLSTTD